MFFESSIQKYYDVILLYHILNQQSVRSAGRHAALDNLIYVYHDIYLKN